VKTRILVLLAVVIALVSLQVRSAQASVAPITTVNAFFVALDAADHAAAIAAFTPDAVATLVRGETYQGPEGIAQLCS
jgi:limonene-1,2-epoxide hydrolase